MTPESGGVVRTAKDGTRGAERAVCPTSHRTGLAGLERIELALSLGSIARLTMGDRPDLAGHSADRTDPGSLWFTARLRSLGLGAHKGHEICAPRCDPRATRSLRSPVQVNHVTGVGFGRPRSTRLRHPIAVLQIARSASKGRPAWISARRPRFPHIQLAVDDYRVSYRVSRGIPTR